MTGNMPQDTNVVATATRVFCCIALLLINARSEEIASLDNARFTKGSEEYEVNIKFAMLTAQHNLLGLSQLEDEELQSASNGVEEFCFELIALGVFGNGSEDYLQLLNEAEQHLGSVKVNSNVMAPFEYFEKLLSKVVLSTGPDFQGSELPIQNQEANRSVQDVINAIRMTLAIRQFNGLKLTDWPSLFSHRIETTKPRTNQ